MFGYWVFFPGFALAFAALFSKTWRLNRILRHNRNSYQKAVDDTKNLYYPGIAILLINLIIMTTWQVVSPLVYSFTFEGEFVQEDVYGRQVRADDSCLPREGAVSERYFLASLALVNGSAVVAANVQIWRARKITTEFSESRYIAIAMLATLQAIVLALPLFFYSVHGNVAFLGRSSLVLATASSILFLIYVPKMLFWRKREQLLLKEEDQRQLRLSVLHHPDRQRQRPIVDFGISHSGRSQRSDVSSSNEHAPRSAVVRSGSDRGIRVFSSSASSLGRNSSSGRLASMGRSSGDGFSNSHLEAIERSHQGSSHPYFDGDSNTDDDDEEEDKATEAHSDESDSEQ